MKAATCVRLENDIPFKKDYLNKISWWKSPLIIAPSLLLFLGLAGMIYLTRYDMLLTPYLIPFVLVFLAGTIWLKAVKKHLQKIRLDDEKAFKVCMAHPVAQERGYTCFVFETEQKRHNSFYIKQLSANLNIHTDNLYLYKKRPILQNDPVSGISYYIIAYQTTNVHKQNSSWKEGAPLPVLYVDHLNVFVIKGKYLQ